MNICFYSPYIPQHFGGGEKHLLDVAIAASEKHTVSIALPESSSISALFLEEVKSKYEVFFNLNLQKITFITTPLGTNASFFQKIWWTKKFDGLYYVTDGSLFFSLARHNYLHIQTPLKLSKSSLVERLKLANWKHKNTNSFFTKKIIEEYWQTKIQTVLHPTVNSDLFDPQRKKEKIILNVGRFFKHLHAKRQDILIAVFKEMVNKYPEETNGWKLYLIGGVEDHEYFADLKSAAEGSNIELIIDCPRNELIEIYNKASIYWHAAGYEVDENEHPQKVEHFGITTAEAMAAGAIPIVVPKGGQPEVVGEALLDLSWQTTSECIQKTITVISDPHLQKKYKEEAIIQVQQFAQDSFNKKVLEMFGV